MHSSLRDIDNAQDEIRGPSDVDAENRPSDATLRLPPLPPRALLPRTWRTKGRSETRKARAIGSLGPSYYWASAGPAPGLYRRRARGVRACLTVGVRGRWHRWRKLWMMSFGCGFSAAETDADVDERYITVLGRVSTPAKSSHVLRDRCGLSIHQWF